MEQELPRSWWDEHDIEPGRGFRWVLGDFELVIFHHTSEWLLAVTPAAEGEVDCEECKMNPVSEPPLDSADIVRFVSSGSEHRVRMTPRVADRPVVARPRVPLRLLPGEDAKIYVSSPVWVEVAVGRPFHTLCEVAVRQMSDTWFGPNTREGEVAYALKTHARTELEKLPKRCYRLTTPLSVTNGGKAPLLLDRINIPVPHLSVYTAEDGSLWSESVSLASSEDVALASMRIGKGAPREVAGAQRLSQPRESSEPSLLVRAFTTLFSRSQED